MYNNILITDLLLPSGHHHFNERLVSALASISNVEFLADDTYSSVSSVSRVTVSCVLDGRVRPSRVEEKRRVLTNGLLSAKYLRSGGYDAIIFSSSDPVLFPVTRWAMRSCMCPVYYVHHRSVDLLLRSRVARCLFSTYRNSVKHVVGEQFIAQALVNKLGVAPGNVVVWPHAMCDDTVRRFAATAVGRHFDVVCLCGNSDSRVIDQLIEYERNTGELTKAGVRVYIKGSQDCVIGNIMVSSKWLEDDEYTRMLTQASVALSLMSPSFGYRVSGSLLDAVECGCCVISTEYPMAVELEKLHPHTIRCVKSATELVCEIIRSVERTRDDSWLTAFSRETREICSSHSQDALFKAVRNSLSSDLLVSDTNRAAGRVCDVD